MFYLRFPLLFSRSRVPSSAVSSELDSRLRHGEHTARQQRTGLVCSRGADEEISDAEPAATSVGSVQLQQFKRAGADHGEVHRRPARAQKVRILLPITDRLQRSHDGCAMANRVSRLGWLYRRAGSEKVLQLPKALRST